MQAQALSYSSMFQLVGGDRGVPIFHYRLLQLSGLLEDQNQNLLGAILPAYCGRQDLGPLAAVETF